jgi:(2Fe-2S) ferredoxin
VETTSEPKCSHPQERCVLVCQYRSCLAEGSAAVLAAFEEADLHGFAVMGTGCQGQCSSGPTVRIVPEETWYCRVKPSDVPVIVEQHLQGGKRVAAKLHPRIHMHFRF